MSFNIKFTNISDSNDIRIIKGNNISSYDVYVSLMSKYLKNCLKLLRCRGDITTEQYRAEKGKFKHGKNNIIETKSFIYNKIISTEEKNIFLDKIEEIYHKSMHNKFVECCGKIYLLK